MDLRLDELIDNYLKYQKNINSFSDLTIKAYSLDLKQAFQNKQKNVKTTQDIWNEARACLASWGHHSLATRNRKIATLKSFFSWVYDQKLTEINYAHQLVCPKVPRKLPHFLSVDEVISVLKYLNSAPPGSERQKSLFLLLYGAGLRISEACNLQWKNVQIREQRLLVLGKGSKERFSMLPSFCVPHFENLLNKCGKEKYVLGESVMNPRSGFELIRKLGAAAGLMNPLHPHALRHSYATHLLASGTNLRVLQQLLGHESLQATEKYTHLSVDHLARLIDKSHPLGKLKTRS